MSKWHGGRRLIGRTFVVYYGHGPLAGLEEFDLAVLEPKGWSTPALRALQAHSVTTLAYVSVLEVPPWLQSALMLTREDLVAINGEPWVKEPYGNVVARPESQVWRRYLIQQLETLYRGGWDGLFLDTLGDVEDEALAEQRGALVPGTADLVRLVRAHFPDRPIVVNNGMWRVVPLIVNYIDGVCWEGPLTPEVLGQPWAQALLEFLGRLAQERGWTNLMLTQIAGTSLKATQNLLRFGDDADRYGFLAYAAPGNYVDRIRLPDGRIVGPQPSA
ncbi:MAG: hypothetical protein C7B45_06160 [Sulfobacillus acidophilus]|uniref:Glycoside-hydrolase family GH114 TIM-barrel domain-containing protein n=1 Tax=Sulfobacillus acidophilus TaxID=53633 RepID=A0A2T2WK71_9FIRM|nr:MAG: hypothetical protein C7B45_06160 [Sulfobacillus acidophilus]